MLGSLSGVETIVGSQFDDVFSFRNAVEISIAGGGGRDSFDFTEDTEDGNSVTVLDLDLGAGVSDTIETSAGTFFEVDGFLAYLASEFDDDFDNEFRVETVFREGEDVLVTNEENHITFKNVVGLNGGLTAESIDSLISEP